MNYGQYFDNGLDGSYNSVNTVQGQGSLSGRAPSENEIASRIPPEAWTRLPSGDYTVHYSAESGLTSIGRRVPSNLSRGDVWYPVTVRDPLPPPSREAYPSEPARQSQAMRTLPGSRTTSLASNVRPLDRGARDDSYRSFNPPSLQQQSFFEPRAPPPSNIGPRRQGPYADFDAAPPPRSPFPFADGYAQEEQSSSNVVPRSGRGEFPNRFNIMNTPVRRNPPVGPPPPMMSGANDQRSRPGVRTFRGLAEPSDARGAREYSDDGSGSEYGLGEGSSEEDGWAQTPPRSPAPNSQRRYEIRPQQAFRGRGGMGPSYPTGGTRPPNQASSDGYGGDSSDDEGGIEVQPNAFERGRGRVRGGGGFQRGGGTSRGRGSGQMGNQRYY